MKNTCLSCPYIKDELERRMSYYDTDLEFYESYEGEFCYCDKVGGKMYVFGMCSEGGVDYIEPNYHLDIENNGRGRQYRRFQRSKHIKRRKSICNKKMITHPFIKVDGRNKADYSIDIPFDWYKHNGQYSKGKIHCGCPLCKPYKGYYPSEKQEREDQIVKDKFRDYENELKQIS